MVQQRFLFMKAACLPFPFDIFPFPFPKDEFNQVSTKR